MMTAMATDETTAPTIITGRTQIEVVSLNSTVQVASDPNAPIMKTSPWAKLMSWTMP